MNLSISGGSGRKVPARSVKHSNFRRLAAARTEATLECVRKLANLSSPNYEFEDSEVEKMFDTIEEALEEARASFHRGPNKRRKFEW